VLIEFAGSPSLVSITEVEKRLHEAKVRDDSFAYVVERLRELGFLGVQTGPDEFRYSASPQHRRRDDALSRAFSRSAESPTTFEVHPSFRTYLGIQE